MKNNFGNNIRDSLESLKSLESLNVSSAPTQKQKEIILNKVLIQSKTQNASILLKFKNMVFVRPWRFALGASAFQAIVLTAIFGSKYTNLLIGFMGR